MIRWASCGLVVLLAVPVASAQTADMITEVTGFVQLAKLRPNPFGGAPVAIPVAAQKPLPPPIPPPLPPGAPSSDGPRPLRPVYTLPGPPKLDRHGDPLPSGAVARYGTVRLRHGTDIHAMAFTHDGKFLCTVSGSEDTVKLWNASTGKEVARINSAAALVGLGKDGSVVLVDDTRVRVWLPATNTVRDLPEKTIPEGAQTAALAVNPDGLSFALGTESKVLLIDTRTGKTLKELNLPGTPPVKAVPGGPVPNPAAGPPTPSPAKLLYSPDGRWLVGNGQKTGVWLWDLRTGKRVRTYRTEADFPEYTFSPDITKLVVTGERLHLYPLDSEEPVDGFKGPEGVPAFAPRYSDDGKTLYVILGDASVQPLDAATGEEKDPHEAPEMNLRGPFALSPGGTTAAAIDQTAGIRIWNPKTGKGPEVTRLPMLSDPGIAAVGKSVSVLDATNKVHTFDLATGAPGKVIELPVEPDGLPAFWDPVYRRAAALVPNGDDLDVHFIDADTGKVVSKHQVPGANGDPLVSFARANRDRAALFSETSVIVVNPNTGKAVRSFEPGKNDNGLRGAISPDGRTVAVTTSPVTIWEVATGKKRLTIDGLSNAEVLVFSPDSRWLAAWDQAGNVMVVDARTGAVTRRLQTGDANDGFTALAFSPDGSRLAAGSPAGRVTVWDVSSGDTLAPFAGHDGLVSGLVFTADGKKLVSTSQDGTALVWEIPDKPLSLTPVEAAVTGFDEAFRLLGSADAGQAQRARDYLFRNPAEAVKQAADRMPVPAPFPAAQIAQAITDLSSDEFPAREAAVKELEKASGEAAAQLREVVTKSPSPEARKLAAELLTRAEASAVRGDALKLSRAVEVLEQIDTPAARALLEKWAAGPTGHRLTVEASAAVARLKGGK